MTVHVLAVDDHPVVARGILLLARQFDPAIRSLGTCANVEELWQSLREIDEPAPDVVLMDLHLADGSEASETIAELTRRGLRTLIFTSEVRPIPIRKAMQAGAVGLCLKSDQPEQVVEAIRTAAGGEFAVSSDLAFVLVTDPDLTAHLAPREIEALSLLADGVPRKSIGARMDPPVATSTVVTYFNRVCDRYRALGVPIQSTRDAVRAATHDGYLDP